MLGWISGTLPSGELLEALLVGIAIESDGGGNCPQYDSRSNDSRDLRRGSQDWPGGGGSEAEEGGHRKWRVGMTERRVGGCN